MNRSLALLLVLVLLSVEVALAVTSLERRSAALNRRGRARAALAETLGVVTLAIDFECTAARFPTEGLGACLGDVAGGYCAHNSCDLVCQPSSDAPVTLIVERPRL